MEQKFKSIVTGGEEKEWEMRECQPGEVCVKIHSFPINPIDLMKVYWSKEELASIPPGDGIGFDAVGKIVDSNVDNEISLNDKKVAVYQTFFDPSFSGTWRQYLYCSISDIYILPDELDLDSQGCYIGNPLTAIGLYSLSKKYDGKAIVQDAACSSVGKMLFKYATKQGIEVVNIVRSDEQIDIMKSLGATHILNSTDENFDKELQEIISSLKPNIFYDAIGNKIVSQVLNAMLPGATAIIYGTLDPTNLGLTSADFLFGGKTVTNFGCPFWLQTLSEDQKQNHVEEITEDFKTGGKIFGTEIHKSYALDDLSQALEDYPKLRSKGKLIINLTE